MARHRRRQVVVEGHEKHEVAKPRPARADGHPESLNPQLDGGGKQKLTTVEPCA